MNGTRSAAGVFVISKLKVPDELLISICDVVSFSIFHKSEYFNLNLSIETSAFNSLALASSLAFCSAFNLASALAFSSASANILSLFSAFEKVHMPYLYHPYMPQLQLGLPKYPFQ